MKIAFIIGNGFNRFMYSQIEQLDKLYVQGATGVDKKSMLVEIHNIVSLWQELDEIFEDLMSKSENRLNEEQLVRMVHALFELLPQLENFKTFDDNLFSILKELFDGMLFSRIQNVTNKFKEHQLSMGYSKIRDLFPYFGVSFTDAFDRFEETQIFTTNYDGILDALLSKPGKKYIFSDCFIDDDKREDLLKLVPRFVHEKGRKLIAHIHGSYLYERQDRISYKQRNATCNSNPVIVFNNPDYKLTQISTDSVLNEYFKRFLQAACDYEAIILIGNSLETEPHIKNAIREKFDRPNTKLIVCDIDPGAVSQKLRKFYNYKIEEISMKSVLSYEHLFREILNRLNNA